MRQDEFERAVNVIGWLLNHLANPENENDLRTLMGHGPEAPNVVLYKLTRAAEPYGVRESELGSAIKTLASAF